VGSREFLPLLQQAKLTTLEFGDFAFEGNGPGGMPVMVGVERKRIQELAGDLATNRFVGHQLPGLMATYHSVYLVVEGQWSHREDGVLMGGLGGHYSRVVECGSRRFMAREVDKFLTTLDTVVGVKIRTSNSKRDTARIVQSLHAWWQGKEWEEHKSHRALPTPPIMLQRPTLIRAMAACLPGVGWARSGEVEGHFRSVREMVEAGASEWKKVAGIGEKLARRIVEDLNWSRKEGGR
jgi:ERCC4-type nuclease